MFGPMPDQHTVRSMIALAARAPSLHNTQPWHWTLGAEYLELTADHSRQLAFADPAGRQLTISCGVALDHLRLAAEERLWSPEINRLSALGESKVLVRIGFTRSDRVAADAVRRAAAIHQRHTIRAAFGPPPDADALAARLAGLATAHGATATMVPAGDLPRLAEASRWSAARRRYDAQYKAEMQWWTKRSTTTDGIPESALPTSAAAAAVPAGRAFPRRAQPGSDFQPPDQALTLLLSTPADTPLDWLRAGEALSEVLLECTASGLATCPLTHVTELEASRKVIQELTHSAGIPQVLVRIGLPVNTAGGSPATARRPVHEILTVAAGQESLR